MHSAKVVWVRCVALLLCMGVRQAAAELRQGDILISDWNGDNVRQYHAGGTLSGKFAQSPLWFFSGLDATPNGDIVAMFRDPSPGLMVIGKDGSQRTFSTPESAGAGDVVVLPDGTWALSGYQRIEIYNPNGTHVRTIPLPGFGDPYGMTLGADQAIWMTDRIGRRLAHITQDGVMLGNYALDFSPGDLAENPLDGTLWISDRGVALRHFDRSGKQLGSIAVPVYDGVDVADDGTLYTIQGRSGDPYTSVGHYRSDGTLLDSFFTPPDGPSYPMFLTIVPEPSTLGFVMISALFLSRRRR